MDEYVQSYLYDVASNPLTDEDELCDVLAAYVTDAEIIEAYVILHRNAREAARTAPPPTSEIQFTPMPEPEEPREKLKNPHIDEQMKKQIVEKYSAGSKQVESVMTMPKYLREKENKGNKIRFRNNMVVTNKGEKYV